MEQTTAAEQQYTWLCRIAEQGYQDPAESAETLRMLSEIPLYLFTAEKSDRAVKLAGEGGRAYMMGYQDLPFPCIIADDKSCVAVFQSRLDGQHVKTETMVVAYDQELGVIFYAHGIMVDQDPNNTGETSFWDFQATNWLFFQTDGKKLIPQTELPKDPSVSMSAKETCINHSKTALEQFKYVNCRQHYVIKERGAAMKDRKKKKKIRQVPRVHQREVHKVLDPEEMRVLYTGSTSHGTHASPVPHKREGYERTYRHPRYKNMLGKKQKIDAVYVNCKEGDEIEVARRVYHVVSIPK